MAPMPVFAALLPFVALAAQWLLWQWIAPFVWFLFFPAVFFSARLGGLWGGLVATVLSALLVWYFFIPPPLAWAVDTPANLYSVGLFLVMGYLFSDASERLQRARRKTEAALAETSAAKEEISALYRKTLELDELKNQFFANVSHELRTPLTLILAPLERRLRRPAGTAPPEDTRGEDELMLRNARLLYRQVSDMLDAAKLEAGRMGVRYARLDLVGLVRAMASHFESLARERDIDLSLDTPDVLVAEVDGEKLQRILLNLLSNAFKFTPAGGSVALRLVTEDGAAAVLTVQDNGPGVPPALREAVFERFRQVEGGAGRRFGGTGLGLAIVREFVELHGGTVRLDGASGGGAILIVRLPLTAPAAAVVEETAGLLAPVIETAMVEELRPPTPVEVLSAPTSNAPLVLVVEDNADMNDLVVRALRPHYRVVSARDGRDGLDNALAHMPDLILCDVMMPVMDGEEMVAELRRRPEMSGVPVVMLSARADDALRVRLLCHGVQDYITKPFAVDELLARISGLIRERRRTDEALRASEIRFRRLFYEAPMPLCFVNRDGELVDRNARFVQLFGYAAEDVPTLAEWWRLTSPDPGDRARLLATWNTAMAEAAGNGADIAPIEYQVCCKDGGQRTVLISGIALGEDFLVTFFDLTERRRAEQEKEEIATQLQQAQKMESIGRLAGGVAHDFNNLLGVILGYLEMLRLDTSLNKVQQDQLASIQGAGERARNLTQQLLMFSRKQVILPRQVDWNRQIEDSLKLYRRILGEDVQVVFNPGDHLPPIMADTQQLDQILANLLINARDAIHENDAADKQSLIDIATSVEQVPQAAHGPQGLAPGRYIRLQVSDSGKGMDEATRTRIFEPFFTTKGAGQGTGLGLATVFGVVSQNRGGIQVDSSPGRGAVFTILWPALPRLEEGGEETPAEEPARGLGGGETLLLVEDTEFLRTMYCTALNSLGYQVRVAGSAEQVRRLLDEGMARPDLLVTDVVLPGMNGRQLAEELRARWPELPVLYISGYTADILSGHGVSGEGIDMLEKPFSITVLARKIREMLSRRA